MSSFTAYFCHLIQNQIDETTKPAPSVDEFTNSSTAPVVIAVSETAHDKKDDNSASNTDQGSVVSDSINILISEATSISVSVASSENTYNGSQDLNLVSKTKMQAGDKGSTKNLKATLLKQQNLISGENMLLLSLQSQQMRQLFVTP